MQNILKSGKATFNIEVPYKIIESGKSETEEKPLVVYLHGFNQNLKKFQRIVNDMLTLEAYHLFIQAPYPIYDRKHKKKIENWGRSWYLYDGDQDQFVKSLEHTSGFIQQVIDEVLDHISVSRIALFGYSMGGYLAGYYSLSRVEQVNELIVVGARIKTEVFENKEHNYADLNVLALHGSRDDSVKSKPQQESCSQLADWGANVTFKELEESHLLTSLFINKAKRWLASLGY